MDNNVGFGAALEYMFTFCYLPHYHIEQKRVQLNSGRHLCQLLHNATRHLKVQEASVERRPTRDEEVQKKLKKFTAQH